MIGSMVNFALQVNFASQVNIMIVKLTNVLNSLFNNPLIVKVNGDW